MVRQVREAFGGDEYTDERAEQELPLIDFDRFRVADDTPLRRVVRRGRLVDDGADVARPGPGADGRSDVGRRVTGPRRRAC